jgi:hypothetical protein
MSRRAAAGPGAKVQGGSIVAGKGFAFLFLIPLPVPALGERAGPKPMDCGELVAWLAGRVASSQLDRLLHDHGAAFSPGAEEVKALKSAGAEPRLVQSLGAMHSANHRGSGANCPALLVGAAEQVRDRHCARAEYILRPLETADPRNPALHFALGYLRQQQGDWDEALDPYQESEGSEPVFPRPTAGWPMFSIVPTMQTMPLRRRAQR